MPDSPQDKLRLFQTMVLVDTCFIDKIYRDRRVDDKPIVHPVLSIPAQAFSDKIRDIGYPETDDIDVSPRSHQAQSGYVFTLSVYAYFMKVHLFAGDQGPRIAGPHGLQDIQLTDPVQCHQGRIGDCIDIDGRDAVFFFQGTIFVQGSAHGPGHVLFGPLWPVDGKAGSHLVASVAGKDLFDLIHFL